jgi:UDP-glucuronate 4-epimerase
MRALVTGGAGAIGSHLVESLLARGDEVAVLDSFHDFYPRARKEANLSAAREHAGFAGLYERDIRDVETVRAALAEFRPESVYHLAARAGVRPSVEEPLDYADVNLRGTAVVATEAAAAGVRRFVFASSSTVYGENAELPWDENGDTSAQLSPYGATKRGGELFCHSIWRSTGMPITCLRFFSVYGPRQRPDLVIAKFAAMMLDGDKLPILGDGKQERDLTYVDDIVDGVLRACDRAEGFRIYNLGRGKPARLDRVIELLEQELGIRAVREQLPPHAADIARTSASIVRARGELGYDPGVEPEEGIHRTVAWIREERACASS